MHPAPQLPVMVRGPGFDSLDGHGGNSALNVKG